MAQFTLKGGLGNKNPVQCKLNGYTGVGGVLGFGEFCSIFPVSLNDHDVRRIGCLRKVRVLASSSSSSSSSRSFNNSSKVVDENVDERVVGFDLFDDEDDYNGGDDLSCFRGLVLDISYRPVNVVCWKRAICLEFMDKADVLEYYDQTVNSPSGSYNIPAVLRVPHLLQVVKRKRVRNTLSRKNIFHRDDFMCQYCNARNNLTIDHVLPVSRGGKWEWENLVTACTRCNSRKGHKTLEEANMELNKVPKAPKEYDILAIPLTSAAIRMLKMKKGTPEEWRQYLPK